MKSMTRKQKIDHDPSAPNEFRSRTWSEGFSWPGNWRQREMIFYGSCEETVAKEKAFAERFGPQLRFLRLRCWTPAQGPALQAYLENVSEVLKVLASNALLREIHLVDVEGLDFSDTDLITVNDLLFESERKAEGKARMAAMLAELIRAQTELRILDLQDVDCAWEVGLKLVSAAGNSDAARNTLHTLLLSGTFDQPDSRITVSSDDYIVAMGNFRKLAFLRIDYRCLSCRLLDVLGTSLADCFRRLAILCSEDDGPELPNLEDEAWRTLSSRCPFLRVELTIEGGNRNAGWRSSLLKPGMPLAALSLDDEMSNQNPEYWDTTPTLELLLREYRNTLEHLSLSLSQRSGVGVTAEKLTAEMISRALRLKKLKTLHLSGPMDSEAVKTLYNLLDKPHSAKHLQRVTLTVWCGSEEEIDQLLKTNRLTAQSRVSAKTEVRLVPML
ncbi:F-box only protein 39-like isoform X1 [Neodiprion pinetum]|uniref:F-box only protein 39-like isoform X1 n=1 Tax=Neodiprion pinetum TaxID=441929 RepID=UPI0037197FA6